uniref:SCAN box domain-containing protein n=1 Tax=Chrysemys picta bellii TaxID=8478 RepID=A0A8C3P919_CHRPI
MQLIDTAYMALGEEAAQNYEAVRAAILDRVGLSVERYRQKLWSAQWTSVVRPRAFTQRLRDWATRSLRPDTCTMEEIMDSLILEQFLQSLPETVRTWVRRHQPGTVEEAVLGHDSLWGPDPQFENPWLRRSRVYSQLCYWPAG